MNTGSALFRELDEASLRKCARHYLDAPLLGWELLRGGLFNTTYRLDIPGGSVILRLGPVNRDLLLPYEKKLMAAELPVQELLRCHGIPTSRTLVLDIDHNFLDRDVAIVERIPGVNMAAVDMDPDMEFRLCQKAGELTRKIHGITARNLPNVLERPFGRVSSALAGDGCATWREAVLLELSQWRSCAERAGTFSGEEIDRIFRCFEVLFWTFDAVREPVLVHGDLWYGNILVDDRGDIAAVIDGDRAYFGDPDFDLMLLWMPRDPFLEGYGKPLDMTEEAVIRRGLYQLLLRLEDCYILQMEYNKPEEYIRLKETTLQELSKMESYI